MARDRLNRDGRVALYIQIADEIHAEIDGGTLRDKVPTLTAVARTYSVARGTAAAALGLLRSEGVIELSPGHGYFAIAPPHPTCRGAG